MVKPPCKNCELRYPGCHGKCPEYHRYKEEYQKFKRYMTEQIQALSTYRKPQLRRKP